MELGTKVKLSAKTDVVFALIQFKIYCMTDASPNYTVTGKTEIGMSGRKYKVLQNHI